MVTNSDKFWGIIFDEKKSNPTNILMIISNQTIKSVMSVKPWETHSDENSNLQSGN